MDSQVPGIITAVGAIITALGAIWLTYRQQQMNHELQKNTKTTNDTNHIVNSSKTNMENFQRALIRTLVEHGIQVPIDQSLPDDPPDEFAPLLVMEEVLPDPEAEPAPMLLKEVRDDAEEGTDSQ